MVAGEHRTGLAEARRDLVEDQQRAGAIAGGADLLPEARRRDVGHGAHRLGDEGGEVAVAAKHVFDHARAGIARLLRVPATVWAVEAAERRDVLGAGHQRSVRAAAEQGFAADAGCAKASAVEGVPERQCLEAPSRRARDLDRDLDGVRSAGCEQHLRQRSGGDGAKLFGKLHRWCAGETARREGQRVHLLGDRALEARVAVTDMVDVVAVEIHVPLAGEIFEEDALGLADRGQARRRYGLVEKGCRIAVEQRLR